MFNGEYSASVALHPAVEAYALNAWVFKSQGGAVVGVTFQLIYQALQYGSGVFHRVLLVVYF